MHTSLGWHFHGHTLVCPGPPDRQGRLKQLSTFVWSFSCKWGSLEPGHNLVSFSEQCRLEGDLVKAVFANVPRVIKRSKCYKSHWNSIHLQLLFNLIPFPQEKGQVRWGFFEIWSLAKGVNLCWSLFFLQIIKSLPLKPGGPSLWYDQASNSSVN